MKTTSNPLFQIYEGKSRATVLRLAAFGTSAALTLCALASDSLFLSAALTLATVALGFSLGDNDVEE